jgi:uncharacterized protein YggE
MFKAPLQTFNRGMLPALFIALSLGQMSAISAYAKETEAAKINVVGEGRILVAPDIATLNLGVMSEAETAQEALEENNIKMAAIVDSMKQSGIAAKDLQTSNFQIQPKMVYDRPKNGEEQKPPRIVGYTVSNNLSVLVRDLTKVGDILDMSIQLGINNGGNIQFGNDDPRSAITKARTAAMLDAQERANTLVAAVGAKLGNLVEINESNSRPRPVPMAQGRMMADAAMAESVPIEAGENTYRVTVSVSWQIEQ